MRKNVKNGTGPYADRQAVARSARQRPPRQERRVICRECNGAGQTGCQAYRNRDICPDCNGAGEVFA